MKRFWNWKTALMGVVTALLLTLISAFSYRLYCGYVSENFNQTTVMRIQVDGEDGGYAKVTQKNDGEDAAVTVDATPSVESIKKVYGYVYVLYKELCDNRNRRQGKEPYVRYQDLLFDPIPKLEIPSAYRNLDQAELQELYAAEATRMRENVESRLSGMESSFYDFNNRYDYWIVDRTRKADTLTNTQTNNADLINSAKYAYLFQVDYDEHGVPVISNKNLYSGDKDTLKKNLNSVLHEKPSKLLGGSGSEGDVEYEFLQNAIEKATLVKNPTSCTVILGVTWDKYNNAYGNYESELESEYYFDLFGSFSVRAFCGVILAMAVLCGIFWTNPRSVEKQEQRTLARAPLELTIALIMLVCSGTYILQKWMTEIFLGWRMDFVSSCLYVFFILLVTWYVGCCIGEIRILGFKGYFKKRCLLLGFFRFLRKRFLKLSEEYRSLNLGMDLRKKIRRLIILQAVILVLCCCAWFFGIIGVVIYSVLLYFWVMRYVIFVQKDYQKLRRMTHEMAEGNLKYEPEESLGLYEPAKEDLVQIRNGFDKAVQEEVKSQKLKSELITNVSHDLKTPLTAIITYVNLLKDKNLTEQQRMQYVDTLDKKSMRLKRLIEDLFEVSKANSGNVQLNLRDCDLGNLIKQCFYEVEDKLQEKNLVTRLSLPDEKVILKLDGEKTYRIYENLFNNIAKYAMSGTRVYVTLTQEQDRVAVTFKNITEAELYVPAQDLTERFVRGDASRGKVEGSGLGLAIVRSFTELQGGKLELEIDGDLFKVTTIWMKS